MTTLERAKKFAKRFNPWAKYYDRWSMMGNEVARCRERTYRALIRQRMRQVDKVCKNSHAAWDSGFYYGLWEALDILDAVYGRER